MEKDSDSTKQSWRRLSKEKFKKWLIDSLVYNENINKEDLHEQGYKVEDYEEAVDIIKEYEAIIKTNKKNLIFFVYQQGKNIENLRKIENSKVLLTDLK